MKNGHITISCLGSFGRFGNQLFQYSFAKAYAEIIGAELQTPPWVGQKIFNIDDPPITDNLQKTNVDEISWGETDIDLFGYFQFKEATEILERHKLKKWFTFREKWTELFAPMNNYYIAAHVRKGDYQSCNTYGVLEKKIYLEACNKFGLDNSKIVWVTEECPKNNIETEGELSFLPDFMTLVNAPVILRGNSSFSWWAATLGNGKIYSPIIDNGPFHFVNGNHPRFAEAKKHDEFHIKG
jgi:hypothetical protein